MRRQGSGPGEIPVDDDAATALIASQDIQSPVSVHVRDRHTSRTVYAAQCRKINSRGEGAAIKRSRHADVAENGNVVRISVGFHQVWFPIAVQIRDDGLKRAISPRQILTWGKTVAGDVRAAAIE